MKTLATYAILAALWTGGAFAETNAVPSVRKQYTRAELMAIRETAIRKQGGFVVAPATGKRIYLVNLQAFMPDDVVAEVAGAIRETARFAVEVVKAKNPEDVKPESSLVGATVYLVWNDADPRLLVAPEDGWARVNVKRLKDDAPKALALKSRFVKECWRALAMALGASNSSVQPCIMHDVFSSKDLDANPVEVPSPEPLHKMIETGRARGLVQSRRVLYRTACEEGWAPVPATANQTAIWDEVKNRKADVTDPTNRWKRDVPEKK